MKHLKRFNEAVLMPDKIENDSAVNSFETAVEYGNSNGFDVVNYDDFYNSLDDESKKTAPKKDGRNPFFALFHPVRKKPMFVICDMNAPRFIPVFKNIMNDIIGHERVHGQQVHRKKTEYTLPDPNETKSYFSNKEEIMAFSWSIANSLSKTSNNKDDAFKTLFNNKHGRDEHTHLWKVITDNCDTEVINRYKKYIYLYLDKIFNKEK